MGGGQKLQFNVSRKGVSKQGDKTCRTFLSQTKVIIYSQISGPPIEDLLSYEHLFDMM